MRIVMVAVPIMPPLGTGECGILGTMICSFCGTREDAAQALVSGAPGAAICDRCIEIASSMVKERLTPIGDMVLTNIGRLATNDPRFPGLLGLVTHAVVAIRRGRIIWAGPAERMPQGLETLPKLDCGGRAVIPGMIDAHTHLLFLEDRSKEFALRAAGVPEAEVISRGGSPFRAARAARTTTPEDLTNAIGARLTRMLESGTTVAEAAAGYSIDHQDELDLLQVAETVNRMHQLDLVATFGVSRLPTIPPDRTKYMETLIDQVLPEVCGLGYTVRVTHGRRTLESEETRLLLTSASSLGARIRLHCEDTSSGEAYRMALEAKTAVIDHFGNVDRQKAREMGEQGMSVVVTPITHLGGSSYLPGLRDLIRAGVTVALGTDCRPFPVLVESMPLAVAVAVLEMGLTPDQAVWSATRGGAIALGLHDRGYIAYGAPADLVILDAPSPSYLSYRPGTNLIWKVLKNGAVAVSH